ncbi:GerAB/ArcD/ProY family transporter [Alkaliphilus sp. B6464]|uniref:GerAB/ArcD/ProY family transporter n=1 Tax=Alkaliphilus sp. B6464 TaxID=2731219 RepID=UPI001BAE4938|nr:GerAB/ArcD/ProY family transporter [Alkaliphilus sp. B6464]QUH19685.1 GerAB/ArcD/ProY family transporter [Alkaliphilus sp. B6464]
MNKSEKLSGFEMVTILTLLMVGTGILSLPRFLLEASEVDTWLIILSGGIILAIVAFIYGYIIIRFPGKGYFEILSITLTRPIACILSIPIYLIVWLIVYYLIK